MDDLKTEVHSEIFDEKDPSADIFAEPLEMHDEVQEQSGRFNLIPYCAPLKYCKEYHV